MSKFDSEIMKSIVLHVGKVINAHPNDVDSSLAAMQQVLNYYGRETEKMTGEMSAKELRALKITSSRPVYEAEGYELESLKRAKELGLIAVTKVDYVWSSSGRNKKQWKQKKLEITELGKRFLENNP